MQTLDHIRHLSAQELGVLGLQDLAYVRPVEIDGTAGFAICAADGTQMAVVGADRATAFAVVRQNDLEPVSVH